MKMQTTLFAKIVLLTLVLIHSSFMSAQKTIDITYIANEGFLISGENKKILIDGIFSNGMNKYHAPTSLVLSKERGALAPFDSITVLLVSHKHDDHINPAYEAEHMVNDSKTVLIGPSQVNDLLKTLANYNTFKDRVINIGPENTAKVDTTIQGITFKILPFKHPNNFTTIKNLGYIFKLNGFTIFHTGDAISDNLSDYKNFNIAGDSIDIAFFPRWFFNTEFGTQGTEIMKYIRAKTIIAMHINTDKYEYYKNIADTIKGIAPVYFMDTPMEKLSFQKENNIPVIASTARIKLSESDNTCFQIFPSIIKGQFTIQFGSFPVQDVKVEIYSIDGILIFKNIFSQVNKTTIDLTGNLPAIYLVKLTVNGEIFNKKVFLN